jgi:hypothetical protein
VSYLPWYQVSVTAPNSVTPVNYIQGDNPKIRINTHELGVWSLLYSIHDHAGMFGVGGQDNAVTLAASLIVADSVAPDIYCKKDRCVGSKCSQCRQYPRRKGA